MLAPQYVGQRHYDCARVVQRTLQRYRELQDIIAILGVDELAEEDIQKAAVDIGVLLLTDASPEQFELTYMGLLESARGQGFSREIVRFAKEITSREKRLLLLTSVDEKNVPVCQSYLSQGFKAWGRRRVYASFFLTALTNYSPIIFTSIRLGRRPSNSP